MRWMIRLGLTAVLTVGMVIVGIRLISYLIEWWYRPPTSGLKLRPTPAESEYLMESSEGKMRIPKEEEQSRLKLDYLDYTIDSVTTVIERGDGLFYWVLLLACVLLSVLIFAANIRFQHRKRVDETASLMTRTFSRHPVPSSMTSVEEPAWTGVTIRDALIAFNQALPSAKKWFRLRVFARRSNSMRTDCITERTRSNLAKHPKHDRGHDDGSIQIVYVLAYTFCGADLSL